MYDLETERLILRALNANLPLEKGECEVGYWIARPYWGKVMEKSKK